MGVVSGGSYSLLWFFKRTKGEKILSKKQVQGNNYEVTVNNSDSPIIINGDVLTLYENASMRESLRKVVYPLNNKGISDVTFLKNDEVYEKIQREEREYFTLLDKESINEKEDVDYFLITQANFDGKQTGWRLSWGDSSARTHNQNDFSVKILDDDFLQKVKEKRIIIRSDDTIIKAKYKKITQKLVRLSVNWEILEILNIDRIPKKNTDGLRRFIDTL